jgi:hypothetical protein
MGVRIVCANLFCSIPYIRGALRALRGHLYQAYVENVALSIAPRLHIERFARGNTVPPCIDTPAVRGCAVLSGNDMVSHRQSRSLREPPRRLQAVTIVKSYTLTDVLD